MTSVTRGSASSGSSGPSPERAGQHGLGHRLRPPARRAAASRCRTSDATWRTASARSPGSNGSTRCTTCSWTRPTSAVSGGGRHAARPRARSSERGSRATSSPASTARATAGSTSTSATTGTPTTCSTSWRSSARPGSTTQHHARGLQRCGHRTTQRQVARAGDQQARAAAAAAEHAARAGVGRDRSAPRSGTPASTTTERLSAASTPASTSARSRGPSGPRPRGTTDRPGVDRHLEPVETVGRHRSTRGEPPGQTRTSGSGSPSTAGASPARSTSNAPAVGAPSEHDGQRRRPRRSYPSHPSRTSTQRTRHPPRTRRQRWGKGGPEREIVGRGGEVGASTGRPGGPEVERSGHDAGPQGAIATPARTGRRAEGVADAPSRCATRVDRAPVCSPHGGRLLRPRQDSDREGVHGRIRPAALPGRHDLAVAGGPRPLEPVRLPAGRRRRGADAEVPRVGPAHHPRAGTRPASAPSSATPSPRSSTRSSTTRRSS